MGGVTAGRGGFQLEILVVHVQRLPVLDRAAGVTVRRAEDGSSALVLLRDFHFDLVLLGGAPGAEAWTFATRLRAARPWQRWAALVREPTATDEITARAMGAVAVFSALPPRRDLEQWAAHLADRHA